MTPLDSSVITSADYDAATKQLTLAFTSGTQYTYQDVPLEVFQHLTRATSAGKYFQERVRPVFEGTRLEET